MMESPVNLQVPLGRRVMILSDLLLPVSPTPSSVASAHDTARSLDEWDGPGTVIVCGNLFEGDFGVADAQAALDGHETLRSAFSAFCAHPERRLFVLPGWRDPRMGTDPEVRALLEAVGVEIAVGILLTLETAAGDRLVHVTPASGLAAPTRADGTRPWLFGIDHLEDPAATTKFVGSRTLYRRFGRYIWIPPILAIALAVIIHLAFVYRGVTHLIRRNRHARHVLLRVYSASWSNRLLFTLAVVVGLEVLVAIIVTAASRHAWRRLGGDRLPAPWSATGAPAARPFTGIELDGEDVLDTARTLVEEGAVGLVTGGALRSELTHLASGFCAASGGTIELVREHPGRAGLPPVFLHHRQWSWVELETGADLHVRLLTADVDLPASTVLERFATTYHVVKGYKAAGDPYPTMVASWPRGASWPSAPDIAADRIRVRRIRRAAGSAILFAAVIDLIVALSRPAASHLHLVSKFVPLGLAQALGALVALAGIGLLMLARGILRGQRRAWVVAVLLLVATLVLHILHGGSPSGLFVTVLVLLLLVVERDAFTASSDPLSLRSAATTLGLGVVTSVAAATIAVEISGKVRHHPLPSTWTVIGAVIERLVGIRSIALPAKIDDWVSPSLLAIGIALLVIILLLLTRPVVDRGLSTHTPAIAIPLHPGALHPDEVTRDGLSVDGTAVLVGGVEHGRGLSARRAAELRARDIVRRHGTGTLDYFAMRDDKQWFFHRDSLVAYAVLNGTCLLSPDPIGPRSERAHVWDAFRRFTDRNGWGVAVMAAAEEWLPHYRASGMRNVYIGDEAVVDVQRFSLGGGKMKGLRQAVTRIERYGYTAEFVDPTKVSTELGDQLVDLMQRKRRGDFERGFSMMLGRVFDPRDTGLLMTVVRDPERVPVAMVQFVPSSAIHGYSMDLMRRDPGEHPNGLLDFALCSTIEHLRAHDGRGLSLNFAAMRSTLDGETGDGLTQRVERWALRRMSGILQIESLWKFNAKYEPDWLPRYVAFDSAEQFGPALVSILRAESLSDLPVIGRLLVPSAARQRIVTGRE